MRAIKRLQWTDWNEQDTLCVLGGTSSSKAEGVVVLQKAGSFVIAATGMETVVDFALAFDSPWQNAVEPTSILTVTNRSRLFAHSVTPEGLKVLKVRQVPAFHKHSVGEPA